MSQRCPDSRSPLPFHLQCNMAALSSCVIHYTRKFQSSSLHSYFIAQIHQGKQLEFLARHYCHRRAVGHPGGQWPKLGISWSEVIWSTRALMSKHTLKVLKRTHTRLVQSSTLRQVKFNLLCSPVSLYCDSKIVSARCVLPVCRSVSTKVQVK